VADIRFYNPTTGNWEEIEARPKGHNHEEYITEADLDELVDISNKQDAIILFHAEPTEEELDAIEEGALYAVAVDVL